MLLYALCEQEFSVAEAAAYLKITAGEVESALCFWRGAQLLDTAEAEKPAAHAKISLFQSYDGELLAKQVEENATFKTLCEFMEKKLEKLLNKNDLNSLFYLFDYVGLSAEYIMALTEYCVQKGKGSMQYILKTALGKADDGVDTYEKLEEWLRRKRSADDSVRPSRRGLRLGRPRADGQREEIRPPLVRGGAGQLRAGAPCLRKNGGFHRQGQARVYE